MELRELRYFVAIADTGSFSKASEMLFVSQPALTRSMQALEEELGQKLFQRGKRTVSMTPAGILFHQRALSIIQLTNQTEQMIRNYEEKISGDIHFGFGETYYLRYVLKDIREILKDYPHITLITHIGASKELYDRVNKNIDDFAMVFGSIDHSRFNSITLPYREKFCLLTRKDSPLAQKSVIRKEDLENQPLIVSPRILIDEPMRSWLKADRKDLSIPAIYNLGYGVNALASAGFGHVLVYENIVDFCNYPELITIPLIPEIRESISIIWKKNIVLSPAAEMLLEKLKEIYR